jgi:hypothetical protein
VTRAVETIQRRSDAGVPVAKAMVDRKDMTAGTSHSVVTGQEGRNAP